MAKAEAAGRTRRVRLIKFGGLSCAACQAMARAKTLERLREKFPELEIKIIDVTNADGESPDRDHSKDGIDYEANYKLSDEYDVESLPTLVFEAEGFGEVARVEGGASYVELVDAYNELRERSDLAALIPWDDQPAPLPKIPEAP